MKFTELYEKVLLNEKSTLSKLGLTKDQVKSFHSSRSASQLQSEVIPANAEWEEVKNKMDLKGMVKDAYQPMAVMLVNPSTKDAYVMKKAGNYGKKYRIYHNENTNEWTALGDGNSYSLTDALKLVKKGYKIYVTSDEFGAVEASNRRANKMGTFDKFTSDADDQRFYKDLGKSLVKYKPIIIRELERILSSVDASDPFKDKPERYTQVERILYVLKNDSPEQIANLFNLQYVNQYGIGKKYDSPRDAIKELIDSLKSSKTTADVFKNARWDDVVDIHKGMNVTREY